MVDAGAALTRRLLVVTLAGSAGFMAALFWAFHHFSSQLAFAQGADSLIDIATAAMLLWTVALASTPEDSNHPFGHHRAEPLGGLVVAVLAGVLAVEVTQSAVSALLGSEGSAVGAPLFWLFFGKVLFKSAVIALAGIQAPRSPSPALRALKVDARNDILTSLVAIAGALGARYGHTMLDAWLALPMAGWILWSGVELARENIRLLMGEAPDETRQNELTHLAASADGVLAVHDVKAHYLGTRLQVQVHVVVAAEITVKDAHDIGEDVRVRLENESDVGHALVHIDIE